MTNTFFHHFASKRKPPVARTDKREAIFVYRRHIVHMTGVSPSVLHQCFGTKMVILHQLENAQVQTEVAEFLPVGDRRDGSVAIPAGLVPRLEQYLQGRGYVTRHFNKTDWYLLLDAWKRLKETTDLEPFEHDQRILFSTLPRGRFEVQNLDQAAKLIAAAARAHRGKVVHVIAKNRDAVETLARKVNTLVPGRCWRCDQIDECRRSERDCNIMVSTLSYFATMFTYDAGLVILVGGEVANNREVLNYLLEMLPEMLRYAIINQHWKSTSSDEMMLEALFGPVVYRLPADGEERRPTLVAWIPNKQRLKSPAGRLTATDRCQLYWENTSRNKLVANVANALAAGKSDQLKQLGLSDAAIPLVETLSNEAKIAVLVESQAHAAAIQKLLPDWQVYTNANVPADSKRKQTTSRAIITEGFLAGAKPDFDIIIRGTGAAAELPPGQFGSSRAKLSPPKLVVDFDDSFDAHRVKQRQDHYQKNHWRP